MKLSQLQNGHRAVIKSVEGKGAFRKRIMEMGFITGQEIQVVKSAPLHDPIYYRIMDYNVSLRRADAELVLVQLLSDAEEVNVSSSSEGQIPEECPVCTANLTDEIAQPPFLAQLVFSKEIGEDTHKTQTEKRSLFSRDEQEKRIRVALVGNPNCGKTSLFNLASGSHERVGNYSGVTVEAKEAHMRIKGQRIDIVDLPGSYSLSPYSPEELYIRQYLTDPATRPDVVIDVIDTCNLERNLYLTVQIKELGIPVVVALNMFDEFEKRQDKLNIPLLSQLLNTPMIPTVCRKERGIEELFEAVLTLSEQTRNHLDSSERRLLQVNYGTTLEPLIEELSHKIEKHLPLPSHMNARYCAIKLLEGDTEVEKQVKNMVGKGDFILSARDYALKIAEERLHSSDIESLITDHRYGFISGALRETYKPQKRILRTLTDKIDELLIHNVWGYPIFLLILFLMFQSTFVLGAYPMEWIENGVAWLSQWLSGLMTDGPLKDLLIDGIIAGVGGVIVFLPNILILYLFISIMEDTGYMSRATFLMDKLMHRMGLHGKSFIPLIMGFGCNVPAIMGARTIESRQSRLITILVTPFMSCSARLPVYLLLAGAFFPNHAGVVLFALYLFGIVVAVISALLLRKILFKEEDVPFVMELPPYRRPTSRSVLIHMWEKGKEYLRKMGTIILLASIIVWFFGYFPRADVEKQTQQRLEQLEQNRTHIGEDEYEQQLEKIELESHTLQQEQSYLGSIGKWIQPILAPLGFDWKMSIALVTGLPAKEVVVSTLGVIYTGNDSLEEDAQGRLTERLKTDVDSTGQHTLSPLKALSFMFFVLLYLPCIATIVAVSKETGSSKWGLFVLVYTCLVAWVVSFIVYNVGNWFMGSSL